MVSELKYRPDIDGVRAIAIFLVLVYHYGATQVSGGFVGVDVFFVISGYLITQQLNNSIRANGLSLVEFYYRRLRRIAPALTVVLVSSLAVGYFLLMPGDYASLGKSASYSAFGAGNFYFFWNTGYFDREAQLQPLLHMWSLGVEEQFYLVWPILMALLVKATKGRSAPMAAIIGLLIAVSFYLSVRQVAADPKAAFYLPWTRAWELALGALLVFLPEVRSRIVAEIMGVTGIALVAYAALTLSEGLPFPGFNALAPTIGAALLLAPRGENVTATILSTRPIRFLGLISYSLYLWHWPVFVLFRHYANGEAPTPTEALLLGIVSVVLATLSWRFVEQPFRRNGMGHYVVIGSSLAAAAATALAGLAIMSSKGVDQRFPSELRGLASLNTMWEWKCPRMIRLDGVGPKLCAFGAPWETAKTRAVLWGDSHAEHMAPLLASLGQKNDTAIVLYRTCLAVIDDVNIRSRHASLANYTQRCADERRVGLDLLQKNGPINLVILAASWTNRMKMLYSADSTRKTSQDLLLQGLERFYNDAAAPSRRFALIADVPGWQKDPVACAIGALGTLYRRPCPLAQRILARNAFERNQGELYNLLRRYANQPGVSVVLPGDGMCDQRTCVSKLNGEFLYRDDGHLRRNLSPATLDMLAEKIGLPAILAPPETNSAATPPR